MMLAKNYEEILFQIQKAKALSVNNQEVMLVAVTKTVEPDLINEGIALGITDIAENRVQEILRKYEQVNKEVNWHLIGYLQTNKVKYIIDKVCLIHSLDRYDLAKEIDRQAKKIDKIQDCLIQIKISEEDSKKGLDKDLLFELIRKINIEFKNIRICGLMGMAPFFEDSQFSRKYFSELRSLFEDVKSQNLVGTSFQHLSMGMSNDFEEAIQEGSTIVRVGSALFNNV